MTAKKAWRIAPPEPELRDPVLALLPRLADFDIPSHRNSRDLWQGDAALIRKWFAGESDLILLCATADDGRLGGVALYGLRPELMTDAPSAHLEALAVAPEFEGCGAASALLDACHQDARQRGARSMSLHVFDNNQRAFDLYRYKGYQSELRRCIKWFEDE